MTYTVWDIETSIKESFKRKANPFDPDNFVVMSGFVRKGGKVHGEYFGRAGMNGGALPSGWFTKLLSGTTVLVGANIKFDILHALTDPVHGDANRKAWMAWVANGGYLWDIQLAEYLLEGMDPAHHMLALDEMAPRYGGNLKFDEVKAMWQAGISTEDINPDLLRRYLCGTTASDGTTLEHGDLGNTELVYLGQRERGKAAGQTKSILMNMGSLMFTIEAELNGMAVDSVLAHSQAAELVIEIAGLSEELAGFLPADLPYDFNWGSGTQKSCLIFGGTVTYEKRMPTLKEDGTQAYYQKTEKVLIQDEWGGYVRVKGGKNAGEIKTKNVTSDDLDRPKSAMRPFNYVFPRITDPKKKWKGALTDGAGEPIYGTSAEVIEELGLRDIPFLIAMSKMASLTKDLTTYYIVTDEKGEQSGMLTLVQADGIIHHMLNHTSTVTARFSSSKPNLQNLSKEGKSMVKAIFISRFGALGKIIQSDFSSLEVYVQAILTNCFQLIRDLMDGLDMHCVRVSQKENITYEEAFRLCKTNDESNPEFKLWDKKRTKAKIFSFQRAFGAGAATISEKGKMPLEDVEALIAVERKRYPETEKFFVGADGQGGIAKEIKDSSVPFGKPFQHPDIPGLLCHPRKGSYRTPDNKLYTWRQKESPEYLAKKGQSTSFSPTEIKNYPVQGTGAEWAKAAMWLAVRAYYARGNFGMLALLVNQVHDALYTDAHQDVALEAAALLHACMEEASTFMEWYFDWKIPVPVPSDTTWGASMIESGKMPPEFKPLVAKFRAEVRALYIDDYTPSCELKEAA